MNDISLVGVIGAGVMGAGIAELFASKGYAVILVDVDQGVLEAARERIARHDGALLARITLTTDLGAVRGADLIVEAVVEEVKAKQDLFAKLDAMGGKAILATNTSTIRIASIAERCAHKQRVIGMHFYNPAPKIELVEVVRAADTSDETYDATIELSRKLGKTPVTVSDVCGFVGNRVLMPLINEAVWALHDGVSDREGIDTVFTLGMRHPLGPLALADLIGLDTCVHIMDSLREGLGQEKFRPCPLLVEMVKRGDLGRKSGRGFYDYRR